MVHRFLASSSSYCKGLLVIARHFFPMCVAVECGSFNLLLVATCRDAKVCLFVFVHHGALSRVTQRAKKNNSLVQMVTDEDQGKGCSLMQLDRTFFVVCLLLNCVCFKRERNKTIAFEG